LLERESELIPSNVKDSVDYYIENVEDNDWGTNLPTQSLTHALSH